MKYRFAVHEHEAKKAGLHYDLRLEMDGVLKDWVFRKPLPEEVGVRRFGLMQEDHDLSWLNFEGGIKEGYGAGTMKIWDKGSYEIIKRTEDSVNLRFYGGRLRGTYVLMKFKNGWLLFKAKA